MLLAAPIAFAGSRPSVYRAPFGDLTEAVS